MASSVFLGIGSNVGDRFGNIRKAHSLIQSEMIVLRMSSIYESDPMYMTDQPSFLNCVLEVDPDSKTPHELLGILRRIEGTLGRTREIRYGPRTIDLDILFFDQLVLKDEALTIPHPLIQERLFVLEPLAEIAPDFLHPVLGKTVRSLLLDLRSMKSLQRVERV